MASRYDSFWLWAGVKTPAHLERASTVYLLDGELRGSPARFIPLRPSTPHAPNPHVWLVVRTNTVAWPAGTAKGLSQRLESWEAAGNHVEGIQIDFDAATRGLSDYVRVFKAFREQLPSRYKLSITGLMDWSANGDPKALAALAGVVDEVVIQTYQGRETIDGYDRYFQRMRDFPIPFKVGLVEHGRWTEPDGLSAERNFRGYVVFLVNRN
nr:DUF3142 domain-containing protein [uncultured Sphingomonas sp.]